MNTLIAFDEIDQRLNTFNHSVISERYDDAPVIRGLVYALVTLEWEGTPTMLADLYLGAKDDLNSFQNTMERLGYKCLSKQAVTYQALDNLDVPVFIQFDTFCGILIYCENGVGKIYDYQNDVLISKDLSGLSLDICAIDRYSRLFREPPPESQDKSNWIKYCFYRYDSELKMLIGLSLFINLFGALNPFFIMGVYNFALTSGSKATLFWLSLGAVMIALLEFQFKRYRMNILSTSGKELAIYISFHVTSKLLWLPYAMTSSAGVSSQLARLRDIDQFRKLVTADSTLSYFDLPFVVVFLIAILLMSGLAAVTVVIGIIVMIVFSIYARITYQRVTSQSSRANAMVSYQWNEVLANLHSIQGLPIIRVIRSRFNSAHKQSLDDSETVASTNNRIQQMGQSLTQIIGTSSIVIAVLAVMAGTTDPGAMIAIIILVWKALTPIMGIYNSLTRLGSIKNSTAQINALMSITDDRARMESSPPINQLNGDLSVAGLSHRHQGAAIGLTNLSFKVNRGDKLSIVGPPGCGKSTLLNILAGLVDQYQGEVLADGYNIRQFNNYRYRNSIKYIPFDFHIFDGTLQDNFYLYNSDMSASAMWDAIHQFKLDAWLSEGLDTRLNSEFMSKLPSSVRELLRIAIGLGDYKQNVIIIDEPFLGCSAEFSKTLSGLFNNELRHKTLIFTSQERSLIADSTTCLLLDDQSGQKYFGFPDKVLQTL